MILPILKSLQNHSKPIFGRRNSAYTFQLYLDAEPGDCRYSSRNRHHMLLLSSNFTQTSSRFLFKYATVQYCWLDSLGHYTNVSCFNLTLCKILLKFRHMSAICLDRLIAIMLYGQYNFIVTIPRIRAYRLNFYCNFIIFLKCLVLDVGCCFSSQTQYSL